MTSRIESRRRAERALALHAVGKTWQQVADTCGYRSRQAAQVAVRRLDTRVRPENIEALRRSEDEELRIRRELFHDELAAAKANNDTETMLALSRELDRIAARRARLLGLDVPVRTELDITVRQTPAAIIADARERLLASVVDAEVVEIPAQKEIAG